MRDLGLGSRIRIRSLGRGKTQGCVHSQDLQEQALTSPVGGGRTLSGANEGLLVLSSAWPYASPEIQGLRFSLWE